MFAARRLMASLQELWAGQADIAMKTDGEAAVKVVIDDVAWLRPTAKTIHEQAPRGNGVD